MITLSYVEFYSGIGGWGYALEHACRSITTGDTTAAAALLDDDLRDPKRPKTSLRDGDDEVVGGGANGRESGLRAEILAAYDHSELCNSVFYHNHVDPSGVDDDPPPLSSSFYEPATNQRNDKTERRRRPRNDRFKPRQTPIERLTPAELEAIPADIWCMSPPCQPHTRQHPNRLNESSDPRSRSFLHLCRLLGELDERSVPAMIVLENVVGFERSCPSWDSGGNDIVHGEDEEMNQGNPPPLSSSNSLGSFRAWRRVLLRRNYRVSHFHLDPTHVGLPNSRPRHYTVAIRTGALRKRLVTDAESNQIPQKFVTCPTWGGGDDNLFCLEELGRPPIIHDERSLFVRGETSLPIMPCIGSFLDSDLSTHNNSTSADSSKLKLLQIPEKVRRSSSSWCFDIVTPHHHRSSCFTHSYGKFVRGTGSILYTGPLALEEVGDLDGKDAWCNAAIGSYLTNKQGNCGDGDDIAMNKDDDANGDVPSIDRFQLVPPEERRFDPSWSKDLDWDCHVRYFSGTEIAQLMGFPVAQPLTMIRDGACLVEEEVGISFRKFSFPTSCTMKQQWKLLGNSLNVRVAACVAEIGLRYMLDDLISNVDGS